MPSPIFFGPSGASLADFRGRGAGVTFDAGPGPDLVLGSRFADTLLGGAGSDALFGNDGPDTLEGGQGLDLAAGGGGGDTFVFRPGDLVTSRASTNGSGGLVDTVLDFQGAGTSGSGDQDVIRLEGFGAGTTLAFAGLAGGVRSLQHYEVRDPTTPGADGFILVSMAKGGTRQLTGADVAVVPPSPSPPPNRAPTDVALSNADVDENRPAGAAVGVLAATDPDAGDAVTFALVDDAGGRFALAADGVTLVTTQAFDFEGGPASFDVQVRATDGGGLFYEETLTVAVGNVNEAPAAAADGYDATEDTPLVVDAAGGVLANDQAGDGGLQAVAGAITTALGGTVTLVADGSFTYAPAADRNGADSFAYTVRDADGDTAAGTVTLTVAAVQDPVAPVSLAAVAAGIGGFRITGEAASENDFAGTSVAAAGDLNGDGLADLLVGASGNDAGGTFAGAAYVLYGSEDWLI